MFSILSRRCPLLATSLSVLFCLLSMLIPDSRFDLVWFRLSCDHGWIRSGSVNVRKQQQQQQQQPVFFFRATPSPRFTGVMPVYRGGSFFHARGAPPAAAHSHTRCCTQHNTTRWVLRAAANTCLHTMPCAASVEQRTIFVRRKWISFMRGPPNQPCRPTSEQCFLTHNWYSSTAV